VSQGVDLVQSNMTLEDHQKTYIGIFENFLLSSLWHENLVKLEALQATAGIHLYGVLIRRLAYIRIILK
jgi:hypothetical protein